MMTDLAEDLSKKGIEITVICGKSQNDFSDRETYQGIKIERVNVCKLNKKIIFFRYLNYLSFFPSVLLKTIFLPRPDCIFIVSYPPFMYLLGFLIKKIKRAKLVINIQDLFPDVAVKLKLLKSPLLIKILEKLTLYIYKRADLIICIGETMGNLLIKKGVKDSKLKIIHNWADGKQLFPIEKKDNPFVINRNLSNKFIVQYSGNFGMAHEIDTVLEAAKMMSHNKDILFLFIGNGIQYNTIDNFIRENNLPNIRLFPLQPRSGLNFSLNASDVSLVTIKAGLEGTIVPSKIYGIMATAKAILAICNHNSEIATIINECKCGMVIKPGDSESLVKAISLLYDNESLRRSMGKRGRLHFLAKFERSIGALQYYFALNNLSR